MYRATREFILARQKHTSWKLTTPKVRQIGGGEPNECFENAVKVMKASKASDNKQIVMTGWIVQPFDKVNKCTAIIQHWWNVDANGNHFDITPNLNPDSIYVQDTGLYKFCIDNDPVLITHVGNSLLYINGGFEVLVDTNLMKFKPVDELKTEYIYNL